MPLDGAIIGEGIYTPREAARLIGGTPQQVLRWTRGSGASDPIWKAHYQFLDDTTEVSFIDLIELRVVRGLLKLGASLQAIRYAIGVAKNKFGIDRPLSSVAFQIDGREILMDAIERDGELVSLSRQRPGQKVFRDIVAQSVSGLEYDGSQVARWRPIIAKHVVIDPKRSFGDPIVDEIGVSTSTLYKEWMSRPNFRKIAALYEVKELLVRDAVKFEKALTLMVSEKRGQGLI